RVDAQPGIEHAVAVEASRQVRRLRPVRRLLGKGEAGRQAEREHDAAERGREFTPIEVGSVHGQVFPFACGARKTARMMRLWVPQRQRFGDKVARTSASVGCGMRSSNSLAVMIMPL